MPVPANARPFTVSSLTTAVRARLEEHFPEVWVSGEVSNLSRPPSGHLYFNLKDSGATLRCAMFRGMALRMRFDLRDGMEVIAKGGISVYDQRGDYQLIVQQVEPKGIGAAELALRQLREKLFQKGYFDPKRKRPLPPYPRRVALIASLAGDAIRDMLEMLAKRWPGTDVIVKGSLVQGSGAVEELTQSLRLLNALHQSRQLPLHAIVIGRGGGSAEDLAAFNTEPLADAIYESVVPVVAAIGHEMDVSLADLVADYRALTPSQAIVALCPDRTELMDELLQTGNRLQEAMQHRVELARSSVDRIAERPAFRQPLRRLQDQAQRLDERADRLVRAIQRHTSRQGDKLTARAERLESLSPLNVLKRGYSLTQRVDSEQVIRSAAEVQPGDQLRTRLNHGLLISRVERVELPPAPVDPGTTDARPDATDSVRTSAQ